MSNQPNWDEAPDGATLFWTNPLTSCTWFKVENGILYNFDNLSKCWIDVEAVKHRLYPGDFIERPAVNQQLTVPVVNQEFTTEEVVCSKMETTTWDGQGLPPVGVECEYKHHLHDPDNPNAWQKCFIIGFTKDCQWLCFHSYASDSVEMHAVNCGVYVFRPIKTDRDLWIIEAQKASSDILSSRQLGQIYDAGLARLPE